MRFHAIEQQLSIKVFCGLVKNIQFIFLYTEREWKSKKLDSTARLRCLLLFSHHSLLVRGRKAIQKTLVVVLFYIEVDVQISKKWAFCVHAREPLLSRTACMHAAFPPPAAC